MTAAPFRDYFDQLVRAEVITPVGYGKGLPIFRPWGIAIAHRIVDLFVEQFGRLDTLQFRHPSMLIEAEEYNTSVEDFGGYENVYRVHLRGRAFVLRPDSALDNLRYAMRVRAPHAGSSVMAVLHGMRYVTGSTPPLYRDRCIWPFVQFNRIVPAASYETVLNAMLQALTAIFDKLCLPVRMLRVGKWKNYGRDRYDGLFITPSGKPTILSMLFVVGDAYRRMAGIPSDFEAFDLGFTEKALAGTVLTHGCGSDLVLPPSVAPIQAIVASDTGEWPPLICAADRVFSTLVARSNPDWWRIWRRRGVPVIIDSAAGRLRIKCGAADWTAWDPHNLRVNEALRRVENELKMAAERRVSFSVNEMFRGLCIRCVPDNSFTGEVIPSETAVCGGCGGPGLLRFVAPGSQIY